MLRSTTLGYPTVKTSLNSRGSHVAGAVGLVAALLVALALVSPCQAQWSADAAVNLAIADSAGEQVQPKVAPTADGGCWISWFDGSSGYDVRVQKLDAGGSELLAHGGVLVADRGLSSTQDYGLDVDASGNAILAFRDDRLTGTQITAARVSPAGVLLWGAPGVQLTATTAFVAAPRICGTSDGGIVVAWTEDSSARIQKLTAAGAPQWGGGTTLTPVSGSYSPSDLHDAGSDAILAFVHQTGAFGSPRHLLAQKYDSGGSALWGAGHVAVFDGGSLQFGNFPVFTPDGSGGAVFSWYDTSGALQCYAQRVLSGGTEAFAHNGVAVSTDAVRIRVSPSADFAGGTGETFVFWKEQNSLQSQAGVYGQKLDSSGNRKWGATGALVVALGTDDISDIRCIASGGGAFAFWSAAPGFGLDQLHGARVGSAGSVDLAEFDVASTPGAKSRLDAATNASGVAILAWSDERSGAADIFAQNVNPDGTLGPAAVSVPAVLPSRLRGDLGFATPNPMTSIAEIPFAVPSGLSFTLDVVDVRGRIVRSVANGFGPESGRGRWNGRNDKGAPVTAGVYFFRLSTDVGVTSRKITIVH